MSLARRLWTGRYLVAYAALATTLVAHVWGFHHPRTGFTSMIDFGDRFAARRLARLREVPIHTYASSDGYDGQFYAQIAVAGNPLDPELETALDSSVYRTRRVLLPVLAHLAGLGRPAWILEAYALAGVLCWLVLAALLARWWFPPTDLDNLLRWAGTLFGSGMLVSVTRSLTDGPALLAIALGARCLEKDRRFLGAAVLGLSGLVRELSVLSVFGLVPRRGQPRRAWLDAALAAALVVVPLAIWWAVLRVHTGSSGAGSSSNFDVPLTNVVRKLREVRELWRARGFEAVQDEVYAMVALATQVVFVLSRPRRDRLWWRIGAPFAVLMVLVGRAVWEGNPSAIARVGLPLTLAFNVLAPRSRAGLALLVAGNLTLLSAPGILRAPPLEQRGFREGVTADYGPGWFETEHLGRRTWHWTSGSPALRFHNPTTETLLVTLEFEISSVIPRTVKVSTADADRSFALRAENRIPGRFGPFRLPPGDTSVAFTTVEPPWVEPGTNGRSLTFAIYDLFVAVGRPGDPP